MPSKLKCGADVCELTFHGLIASSDVLQSLILTDNGGYLFRKAMDNFVADCDDEEGLKNEIIDLCQDLGPQVVESSKKMVEAFFNLSGSSDPKKHYYLIPRMARFLGEELDYFGIGLPAAFVLLGVWCREYDWFNKAFPTICQKRLRAHQALIRRAHKKRLRA